MSDTHDFETIVRKALLNYHRIETLAQSELAQFRTLAPYMLVGDDGVVAIRGYVVRGILQWALNRLAQRRDQRSRISYEVLEKRYIERLSAREYADLMLISDATAQSRRKAAIKRLSNLVLEELETNKHIAQCKQLILKTRIDKCAAEQQACLRFLALFDQPVSVQIGNEAEGLAWQSSLPALVSANLIAQTDDLVSVPSVVRDVVTSQIATDEAQDWHEHAAVYYEKQGDMLAATRHRMLINEWETAATYILEHQRKWPRDVVRSLIDTMPLNQLPVDDRAELRLLIGDVARSSEDLQVALKAYQQALSANNPYIKARAYFALAFVYTQIDVQGALIQLQACRRHLAALDTNEARLLYTRALLQEIHILLDQMGDLDAAAKLLEESETEITAHSNEAWTSVRSDWHARYALYWGKKKMWTRAAEHQWQAWQFAQEIGDVRRSIVATYRLGNVNSSQNNFTQAQHYFDMSKTLAEQIGDLRHVATSEKGLGQCYFGTGNYQLAIEAYQRAHNYFDEIKDDMWKAITCYDLVEAYVSADQISDAQHYWQMGLDLTGDVGNIALEQGFVELAKTYPELNNDLNSRQRKALNYVRVNGRITNAQYRTEFECSKETAKLDLRQLVERDLLVREGKGRATVYVAPPSTENNGE